MIPLLLAAFRRAARRLRRVPTYSVTVVASLALGIGGAAAVFGLVNAVLLRSLPYPDADRLVSIHHVARVDLPASGLSNGLAVYYGSDNSTFEHVGLYTERVLTLTAPGDPERISVTEVAPNVLAMLRATPALGRLPTAADFQPRGYGSGVLLSHGLWMRRFGGDRSIVGRTIGINGDQATVVGVAAPGFQFPNSKTQAWLPAPPERSPSANFAQIRALYYNGIGRLKPGVTVDAAQRDLQRLATRIPDRFGKPTRAAFDAMGVQTVVAPLKNEFVGGVRTRLWLVMATAGLLLLLTWTNATNLALVHAETQRRDVAVERALGATGRHVAVRWLAEAVLLGGLAGVVGTAIAAAAINAHFGFQADQLPRLSEVRVDAATVSFVAILTAISAILLSAVGMLSAQRRARAGTLTAGLVRTTAGRTEQRGRRVLVGVQISVAMTLLVASGLMTRSFWQLLHARLGFEPAGVYTLFLPTSALGYSEYADHARFHGVIVGRLRATPGIKEVEVATRGTFPVAPTAWHNHQRMIPATASLADSAKAPAPLFGFATPGYFHAMGIPVLAGRVFTTDDARPAAPGVILSAALARAAFGTQSPIGQQVRFEASGPQPFTVVGVVGDVPSEGIAKGPSEILYFPTIMTPPIDPVTKKGLNVGSFAPNQEVYVVKTTLPPASILTAVRGALRDVAPQLVVVDPRALDDLVADSIADTRLTMLLLLVAAAAAMIVGLVGIYGIQAYAVTQRTSELGVRIALGADPGDVITMVVREAALVTALGVAGGLAMATAIGRLMTTLLYGISATDPGVFVGMAALFVVVALMASYIPTRRIATIDLVRALSGG